MSNKLPNSLESEINKFLEDFQPQTIIFSEEGLEEASNYYKKLKEQDEVLFKIKHLFSGSNYN